MVVYLVAKPTVADLVEPLELVETGGIPVWHEKAMESDSQTSLAEVIDSAGFAEKFGPGWDQNVLSGVGIDIGCEQALDGGRQLPLKAGDEDGFQNGSFKNDVSFPCRRVVGTTYRGGRDSRCLLSFCVVFFRGNLLVRRRCRSAELRRRGRLRHGALRQRF